MEPTVRTLAGESASLAAKRYLLATRPMFMTASTLPVILGTVQGASATGTIDWPAFLLAMIAVMLVHSAVNVLNDVYDDEIGTDRINTERIFPYTGGSRFIQNEVLSATQMRRWGYILLVAAAATGFVLFLYKGPLVLAFGLIGIVLGVIYSMPPIQLSARGVGEIAVGLGFGVVPVTGAAWLQSGEITWPAVLLSLPASIWVANILLINGIPDASADSQSGKRSLAVRLGTSGTGKVYAVSSVAAFACVVWAAIALPLSPWTITLPFILLCLALYVARGIHRMTEVQDIKPCIEYTLTIHAAGTLWLALWAWQAWSY